MEEKTEHKYVWEKKYVACDKKTKQNKKTLWTKGFQNFNAKDPQI